MMTQLSILKQYITNTCGDATVINKYNNLLDSFFHKSQGQIITNVITNKKGVTITLSDNSAITIPELPTSEGISFINGLQAVLDKKVDKIAGKELSTNDFTNEQKDKLERLQNYTHPEFHQISDIEGLSEDLNDIAHDTRELYEDNKRNTDKALVTSFANFENSLKYISTGVAADYSNIAQLLNGSAGTGADVFYIKNKSDNFGKLVSNHSNIDFQGSNLKVYRQYEDNASIINELITLTIKKISIVKAKGYVVFDISAAPVLSVELINGSFYNYQKKFTYFNKSYDLNTFRYNGYFLGKNIKNQMISLTNLFGDFPTNRDRSNPVVKTQKESLFNAGFKLFDYKLIMTGGLIPAQNLVKIKALGFGQIQLEALPDLTKDLDDFDDELYLYIEYID